MKSRCNTQYCKNGIIEKRTSCDTCKGTGYTSMVIGVGQSQSAGDKCKECKGRGYSSEKNKCENCDKGWISVCDFCGVSLDNQEVSVCSTCEENPIVIKLAQPLDQKYLDGSRALAGVIKSSGPKGVFVDIGLGFVGYFKSDYRYARDEEIAVRLRYPINTADRGNNKTVPVIPLRTKRFKIVKKHLNVRESDFATMRTSDKGLGKVRAVVTNSFQIPRGPMIIDLVDGNGDLLKVSSNDSDLPRLFNSTVVNAIVRYKVVNEQERSQLYSVEKVKATTAIEFLTKLAGLNTRTKETIDKIEFFAESPVYEAMKPSMLEAAKRIRAAVLRRQNIIIRYHSPCVDGIAGAYAIDHAIKELLLEKGGRREDHRRVVRRLPQRNPFFELREAVRDLSFVLDSGDNVFNLPLYILVDVGSSEESRAALQLCRSYGVDVIIVDHHLPFEGAQDVAHSMLNPDLFDKTASVNSGMIGTELAKFIAAERDLSKEIIQLAAIAGKYDRLEGDEITKYFELSDANEFDRNRIENIISAVDYTTFGLRNFDGGEVVRHLLGISLDMDKNTALIENITPTARSLFAKSLKVMKNNASTEDLDNGSFLALVDFDQFAPRFEYPMHSDILAAFHYSRIDDVDGIVHTIGYGSDYLIIRSSNLSFFFPEFFDQLNNAKADLSLSGSGHRSSGSIQFYTGQREQVLEEIKKLLAQ